MIPWWYGFAAAAIAFGAGWYMGKQHSEEDEIVDARAWNTTTRTWDEPETWDR